MDAGNTKGPRARRVLLISVVLVPALAWLTSRFFDPALRPIAVTGTVQAKEIPVASKVGGRIARVPVQEGQIVSPGQVLVEFEMPEIEARRAQLTAAIEQGEAQLLEARHGPRLAEIDRARAFASQAQAKWQMLAHGYREEDIFKAQAQRREAERSLALLTEGYRKEDIQHAKELMEEAEVNLRWAEKDCERYTKLAADGAVSQRDAEQCRTKVNACQQTFEAATENYKKMVAGPRPDEIRAARERLNHALQHEKMMIKGPRAEELEMARQEFLQAKSALTLMLQGTRYEQIKRAEAQVNQEKAALKEVESQLKERTIVSPCEAEVSVMDLHAGEVLSPNKPAATLTRLDMVWTRVYLPERELGRVRVGQAVEVRADAFPGKVFPGKIVQIPGVAEFTPRNVQTPEERSAQVFGLKVTIDNKERLLRGGMNAEITLPPVAGPLSKVARNNQ